MAQCDALWVDPAALDLASQSLIQVLDHDDESWVLDGQRFCADAVHHVLRESLLLLLPSSV